MVQVEFVSHERSDPEGSPPATQLSQLAGPDLYRIDIDRRGRASTSEERSDPGRAFERRSDHAQHARSETVRAGKSAQISSTGVGAHERDNEIAANDVNGLKKRAAKSLRKGIGKRAGEHETACTSSPRRGGGERELDDCRSRNLSRAPHVPGAAHLRALRDPPRADRHRRHRERVLLLAGPRIRPDRWLPRGGSFRGGEPRHGVRPGQARGASGLSPEPAAQGGGRLRRRFRDRLHDHRVSPSRTSATR